MDQTEIQAQAATHMRVRILLEDIDQNTGLVTDSTLTTVEDVIVANAEHEDFCAQVITLEVGQSFQEGGGAAALVRITKVEAIQRKGDRGRMKTKDPSPKQIEVIQNEISELKWRVLEMADQPHLLTCRKRAELSTVLTPAIAASVTLKRFPAAELYMWDEPNWLPTHSTAEHKAVHIVAVAPMRRLP